MASERDPVRKPWIKAAALIAAALLGAVGLASLASGASLDRRLMARGDEIIVALEAYRAKHQAYPSSLEHLPEDVRKREFWVWHFYPHPDGFTLATRTERRHVLSFRSGEGWYKNADDGSPDVLVRPAAGPSVHRSP